MRKETKIVWKTINLTKQFDYMRVKTAINNRCNRIGANKADLF